MKKKLLIILSIMALSMCLFAVSISASNYIVFPSEDVDMEQISPTGSNWTVRYIINTYNGSDGYDFDSSIDETFGFVEFSATEISTFYGFINIEWWHEYLTERNVKSVDDFCSSIENLVETGAVNNTGDSVGYYGQNLANELYSLYQSYVAELNDKTYEQGVEDGIAEGKIQGVAEYKESAEFKDAMADSFTEGMKFFKETQEYKNALNLKYQTGLADGKSNYIESDEYATALQAEYDKGAASIEKDDNINNIIGVIIPLLVICGAVCFVLVIIKKKRRRY